MERLSDAERKELWDRWEAGESQRSIARALDRAPATIRTRLLSCRWRRPVPGGEWSPMRLSLGGREEISRGIAQGESLRLIVEGLGRSSSTVSRKVRINGGCDQYRVVTAHRASRVRARRPKAMKLELCPRLKRVVEDKLRLWWSPTQISGWLVVTYPVDEEMRVSHETILPVTLCSGLWCSV
jgi:IS30 family transposase